MELIRSTPESWILNLRIYLHEILRNMCLLWFFLTAQDWEKSFNGQKFFFTYNKFVFSVIRKYLCRFKIQDSGFDLMNMLSACWFEFCSFFVQKYNFSLSPKKSVRREPLAHSYVIESNHFQRFNNKEDWNAGNSEIQFRWESQRELNLDVILKIYHQILTYIFFIFNSIWKLWNYYNSDLAWTNIENEMHEKGLEKTHKKQQITLRHCNC